MDGEQVLLNPATGVYHLVNKVGGEVLASLADGASVGECVQSIAARSKTDESVIRADVQAFLDGLLERGLLVNVAIEA
jgi:hypothetical protein